MLVFLKSIFYALNNENKFMLVLGAYIRFAGEVEREYALCANVSFFCHVNLNRVEIEPYCLELVDKNMLLHVVFFTLKSFIYIVFF